MRPRRQGISLCPNLVPLRLSLQLQQLLPSSPMDQASAIATKSDQRHGGKEERAQTHAETDSLVELVGIWVSFGRMRRSRATRAWMEIHVAVRIERDGGRGAVLRENEGRESCDA